MYLLCDMLLKRASQDTWCIDIKFFHAFDANRMLVLAYRKEFPLHGLVIEVRQANTGILWAGACLATHESQNSWGDNP